MRHFIKPHLVNVSIMSVLYKTPILSFNKVIYASKVKSKYESVKLGHTHTTSDCLTSLTLPGFRSG